jgi:hypothetical protein
MNQEKVAEVQDESVTKDNNIITVNLPTKVRRFTFSYATKESCPIVSHLQHLKQVTDIL